MDAIIKWALSQSLGTIRGAVVYGIYVSLKGTKGDTNQAVLLFVVNWALCQVLGADKGAAAFATVQALIPAV